MFPEVVRVMWRPVLPEEEVLEELCSVSGSSPPPSLDRKTDPKSRLLFPPPLFFARLAFEKAALTFTWSSSN